ncbi:SDR family NAD(P)-dependent oxidoreductase [Plantactinospora soyae]|uniref:NADP-dependent 3-hydroxy acid dehydrogenase YdfG n=1 Tax=Plantactinospora soyae TaxID=1544732 RepID=A0A927MDJ9_9ACTN|nr:SDR family oxidoreductase [Plantactinospora soyae]MBE1491151.1 short-subunit dehydrogenase [Plantactinospora soyae]
MSDTNAQGIAVITGASTGLGAVYADRLARRGHDLLLVARNKSRLDTVAAKIAENTGRTVEVLAADLADPTQLATVETRLRTDESISLLVNNAGGTVFGPLSQADPSQMEDLITLNVTSLTRLTTAVLAGFTRRGSGTIINLSSALALNVLPVSAVYSGTKSYVVAFTQALQQELAESEIRVQAVFPGAVRTEFWDGSGIEVSAFPEEWVMSADDAVDAALAGLDAGEPMTLLSLPDITDWDTFDAARQAMIPNLSRSVPADRYQS